MISDITAYQIALLKPKNFDSSDPENIIQALELSFENVCSSLEELGIAQPYKLPTFSFYSKIAYFEKKNAKR